MNTDHWEHAKELFAAALELPEKDRPAFLRKACPDNSALRLEVESLLSGHAHAGTFLEKPARFTSAETAPLAGMDSALRAKDWEPSAPAFAPDETVAGRFRIIRLIGRGGMGEVYEARDLELGERVALKTIRAERSLDERGLARFKKEVQLARRVTHPNVCRIFDLERHQAASAERSRPSTEVTFLTMELLEGETLAERLARVGPITTAQALPIVEQMAQALAAAHAVGVVHRDFKPGNVMLVPSSSAGGGERAVVTDFGLARAVPLNGALESQQLTSLTESGQFVGTIAYMAPEQLRGGEVTPATDVYALGLVMYEMVAGTRPASPPAPVAGLDPNWRAAIFRCLEYDPAKRFSRPMEVVRTLAAAHSPAPVESGGARSDSNGSPAVAAPSPHSAQALKSHAAVGRLRAVARRKGLIASIIIATVVVRVAVFAWHFRVTGSKGNPAIAAGGKVFLTDIGNSTGDAQLSGVTELLRNALSQSAHFNLMSPSRVCEVLKTMARPCNANLDSAAAREVALRDGVSRVVFGTLTKVSEDYVLYLDVEKPDNDPTHRRQHWSQTFTATSKDGLFDRIRDGSNWIRKIMGEADQGISEADRPPQDITTSSWEALQFFAKARQLNLQGQRTQAIDVLKQAIEKDPQFASAYAQLGNLYDSLRDFHNGYSNFQKALNVSGARRLSLKEELFLKGMYAIDRSNLGPALEAFNAYRAYYPHDWRGSFFRGYPLLWLDRPEEAIQTLEDAYRKDPTDLLPLFYLPAFNVVLNRFGDAARWNEQLRRLPEKEHSRYYDGAMLFVQHQPDKALEVYRTLERSKDPSYQSRSYLLEASVLAETGKIDDAMEVLKRGEKVDLTQGRDVYRAVKLVASAHLALKNGDRAGCREASLSALHLDSSYPETLQAGSLLARCGFIADARRVLDSRDKGKYPPVSEIVLYRLRGEILLAQGQKKEALVSFEKASQLDMPAADREYLARALVADGQYERAWSLYKRVADRPGLIWQEAEVFPPGFWGDMLCQYAALGTKLGKPDVSAAVGECVQLRGKAGIQDAIRSSAMKKR